MTNIVQPLSADPIPIVPAGAGATGHLQAVCKIPLRDITGEIVDYALVSPEWEERVSKFTWSCRKYKHTSYAWGTPAGKLQSMHRFICGEPDEGMVIDHRDANGLNNTSTNLRKATFAQNAQNRVKKQGTTSKYIGVSYSKKNDCWVASCGSKYIGQFKTEDEAGRAYDIRALIYYGDSCKLNNLLSDADVRDALDNPDKFMPKKRELPAGVTFDGKKYTAIIWLESKANYIGRYDTVEAASAAYVKLKSADVEKKMKEHMSREIEKNAGGVAIIPIRNIDKEVIAECLVDDEDWHRLMLVRWSLDGCGYAQGKMNDRTIAMHRVLVEGKLIDHINRIKLDNRKANLRSTDSSANSQNKTKVAGTKSKYLGVFKQGNNWTALISKDYVRYKLGIFSFEDNAARAYNQKALELYDNPFLNDVPDEVEEEILQYAPRTKHSVPDEVGGPRKLYGVYKSGLRWRCAFEYNKTKYDEGSFETWQAAAYRHDEKVKELGIVRPMNNIPQTAVPSQVKRKSSVYSGVSFDKKRKGWVAIFTKTKSNTILAFIRLKK